VLTQVKHQTASFIAKNEKSVKKMQLLYSGTNKHLTTGLCNTESVTPQHRSNSHERNQNCECWMQREWL